MTWFFNHAFDNPPEQSAPGRELCFSCYQLKSLASRREASTSWLFLSIACLECLQAEQIWRFVREGWLNQAQHSGSVWQSWEETWLCSSTEVTQVNHQGLAQKIWLGFQAQHLSGKGHWGRQKCPWFFKWFIPGFYYLPPGQGKISCQDLRQQNHLTLGGSWSLSRNSQRAPVWLPVNLLGSKLWKSRRWLSRASQLWSASALLSAETGRGGGPRGRRSLGLLFIHCAIILATASLYFFF